MSDTTRKDTMNSMTRIIFCIFVSAAFCFNSLADDNNKPTHSDKESYNSKYRSEVKSKREAILQKTLIISLKKDEAQSIKKHFQKSDTIHFKTHAQAFKQLNHSFKLGAPILNKTRYFTDTELKGKQIIHQIKSLFSNSEKHEKLKKKYAHLLNTFELTLSPKLTLAQVQKIKAQLLLNPAVLSVEENGLVEASFVTNDTLWTDLYGIPLHRFDDAWNTNRGALTTIAVIDTGIDFTHEDFVDTGLNLSVLKNNLNEIPNNGIDDDANGYIDDDLGWNFISDTRDVTDDHGHGSHVSGIAVAIGNNATGVVGAAFESKVLPIKALDNWGYGSYSGIASALMYACDQDVDVVNLSLVGGFNTVMQDAVNYCRDAGTVIVAAAGNANIDSNTYYPCNFPGVICSASVDAQGSKSWFSNWGIGIDVTAAGSSILSVDNFGGYTYMSGTSMATPFVAALAALIQSNEPTFSTNQVQQAIRKSTGQSDFVDVYQGYGLIDANNALQIPMTLASLITAPFNGTQHNRFQMLTIEGTAQGPYQLEYWNPITSSWTAFASGQTAVTDDILGVFDPQILPDGTQSIIRLSVMDINTNISYTDRIGALFASPPSIAFTSPPENTWVGPTGIMIQGTASDNVAIDKVEISIDYGPFQLASQVGGTWDNWEWFWTPDNNQYQVKIIDARATDNLGTTTTVRRYLIADTHIRLSDIIVSQITDTTATISWTTNRPSNTTVNFGPTNTYGNTTTDSIEVTDHSITLTGLSIGTLYHYQVQSVDSYGSSKSSADAMFTTTGTMDTSPPSQPSQLSASVTSSSSISLSWSASTDNVGVSQYDIYRDNVFLSSVSGIETTYEDNGLSVGVYTYTVQAIDGAGNLSAMSFPVTESLADTIPPTDPTNLSVVVINNQDIALSWNASSDNVGVDYYDIYRDNIFIAQVTGTSHTDFNLPGGNYAYTVQAMDGAGNLSGFSNTASATILDIDSNPPSKPVINYVFMMNNTDAQIGWSESTDNIGVTNYQIYRDSNLIGTVDGSTLSYIDPGLSMGTYTYEVRALDAAGNESDFSDPYVINVSSDTIAPSTPTNIQFTITGSDISLSWDPSTDNVAVLGYQIFRDGAPIGNAMSTTFTDPNMQSGTYEYTVVAWDQSGNASPPSPPVTVDL
jgi:subtilisin family serine protease/chitodextrinase